MKLTKKDKQELINNVISQFDAGKFFKGIPQSEERLKKLQNYTENATFVDLGQCMFLMGILAMISCTIGCFAIHSVIWGKAIFILFVFMMLDKAIIDGENKTIAGLAKLETPEAQATNAMEEMGIYNAARGVDSALYKRLRGDLVFAFYAGLDSEIEQTIHVTQTQPNLNNSLNRLNNILLEDEDRGNMDSSDYRYTKKAINLYLEKCCQHLEETINTEITDRVITNIIKTDRLELLPTNVKKAYTVIIGTSVINEFN